MLTRYTRDGIVRDLLDGKHVGLIAPRLDIARTAFLAVLDTLVEQVELDHILTATGRERLEVAGGGQLSVHSSRPDGLRGRSFDVLVILQHTDLLNLDRLRETVEPTLYARNGELILA